MPTRREQLQAHRFVTRRIVSAMLSGDPESTDRPTRRLGLAVFTSAMVGVVAFAGIGVYGLLSPGGSSTWKKNGALIVERETGARFVYTKGSLYPVINYASARLLLGSGDAQPQTVSEHSMAGVPRGRPVGIQGAPDSLPSGKDLLGLPWSVCSSPRYANSASLATEVMVGHELSGGSDLTDNALVVNQDTTTGTRFLLWHKHRLRIPGNTELAALNLASAQSTTVSSALLNAVPQGPDLAAPSIPQAGQPGKPVNGQAHANGDLFQIGDDYYVLVPDGLAPVSSLTEKLLAAHGGHVTQISAAAAGSMLTKDKIEPDGMPATPPTAVSLSTDHPAVCAAYRPGSADATLTTYGEAPPAFDTQDTNAAGVPATGRDQVTTAQKVIVPGGHGALVRAEPAPGVTTGTEYLVTDQGYKFPLGHTDKADAATSLGYAKTKPVPVPRALLDLVPTGPTLDQQDAGMPASAPPAPTVGPTKQTTG